MKKNEQASLQLLKITIITLILMLTFSIAVRAFSNSSLNNVKIKLSNNYEMNIVTTKKKVSDILNENHIVVLPDEIVFPSLDSELEDNNIIKIAKANSEESKVLELANSENIISAEQVLGNYANVIEKIETVDEVIPYETITKDTSSVSSDDRTNKVIQQGKDGLKRTTYKVKYKNDIEISRTVISEEIIEKAVNKIVQVNKSTSRDGEETSRTGSTSIASIAAKSNNLAKQVEGITPIVKTLNASAYTASTCGKKPTDKGYGKTASGAMASSWYTVAAGKSYPMGTVIYIPSMKNKPNGGWFVVQDRGGAISNNKLDIYMNTYNECIQFGRKNIECYIYVK
jgi:3D (Asp-Asp-Asp) domain-containing protein/uncharacterized protein YabE (DUF348 family)